jgi:adenosyl cobinamide kinase/adenosyl cobinamide phosphate guanylyltransferase
MQSISAEHKNKVEVVWQVWLSNSIINAQRTVDAREQVRSLANHVKNFENTTQCEQFIRSLSNDDRVVLIVDDELGQQIVPQVHELQQVFAIYVCTPEKHGDISWFKQFSKVTVSQITSIILYISFS